MALNLEYRRMNYLIRVLLLVLLSQSTYAAKPQLVVGQFQRDDGITIRAMEKEMDGVIGFIGYDCWFVLPDGKEINDPFTPGNCVVRTGDSGADVYNFPFSSRWFPVANRVLQFDGYQFTEAAQPWKYWLSPAIHTAHYITGYLIALAIFTPFLLFGVSMVNKAPKHRWGTLLRVILILIGVSIAAVFGLLMSLWGPLSFGISIPLLAIYVALYLWRRKAVIAKRMMRSAA
jgi:hypothetical protein